MTEQQDPGVLEIEREIRAAPERVFRALTSPEDLVRWWTGIGGLKRVESDLRAGGRYRLEFQMEGGRTAFVQGEYVTVDPPRRLVMTWISPDYPDLETLLAFELEPIPSGTRLRLRHSGLTRPGSLPAHLEGWIEALGLLLAWLAAAGPPLAAASASAKEE